MENNLLLTFKNNFLNEKFSPEAFTIHFMLVSGKNLNTTYTYTSEINRLIYFVLCANISIRFSIRHKLFQDVLKRNADDILEFQGKNAINNLINLLKSNIIYYSLKKKDIIEILSTFAIKTFDVLKSKLSQDMLYIDDDDTVIITDHNSKYFMIDNLETQDQIVISEIKNLKIYKEIRQIINAVKIN